MATGKVERDYTTSEAARLCKMSGTMVRRYCDEGRIDSYLIPGSTHRRITRAALLAFLQTHNMPIPAELKDE